MNLPGYSYKRAMDEPSVEDLNIRLLSAASCGNWSEIRELITGVKRADVNCRNEKGWTPLHLTAFKGYSGAVKVLLMSPVIDVNLRSSEHDKKRTALHWASWQSHVEVVTAIIFPHPSLPIVDSDDDANEYEPGKHHSRLQTRRVESDGLSELGALSVHGNLADMMTQKDPIPWQDIQSHASYRVDVDVNARDSLGLAPIHYAVKGNSSKTVATLLARDDLDVNTSDNGNKRPIFYAVQQGGKDGVQILTLLLKRGALVSENSEDSSCETMLHVAAMAGRDRISRILMSEGCDVNAVDSKNRTPLLIASQYGHVGVVNELLRNVADVNVHNSDLQSPVLLAAQNGHADVLQALVECDANVNFLDVDGRRPLHYAAGRGHRDCVIVLLNSGTCMFNAVDREGRTALHWACNNDQLAIVELLVQVEGIDLNVQDTLDRCTPMHHAAARGHHNVVRALLQAGADPELYDGDISCNRETKHRYRIGRRPLEVALANGHDDVLTTLRLHMKLLFTDGGAGRNMVKVTRKKIA